MVNQRWESCKYGAASNGGGDMAHELKDYGLAENYDCENDNILNLGVWRGHSVRQPNGEFRNVARLYSLLIGGELSSDEANKIRSGVELNLAKSCANCKFYERK